MKKNNYYLESLKYNFKNEVVDVGLTYYGEANIIGPIVFTCVFAPIVNE